MIIGENADPVSFIDRDRAQSGPDQTTDPGDDAGVGEVQISACIDADSEISQNASALKIFDLQASAAMDSVRISTNSSIVKYIPGNK